MTATLLNFFLELQPGQASNLAVTATIAEHFFLRGSDGQPIKPRFPAVIRSRHAS
jgi:hypothetical protein